MRLLSLLGIVFLQSCSSAPRPDFFELRVEPVVIIKAEESIIGLYNINVPPLERAEKEKSPMFSEAGNRIKREAEEPPAAEATPPAPEGESAGTSAAPAVEIATPSSEAAAADPAPNPEDAVTEPPPNPQAEPAETDPAPADPPAEEAPGGNTEAATMANSIAEAATEATTAIQNAGPEPPIVSQNVENIQKAAGDPPAVAQNVPVEAPSGGFGMPDMSNIGSTLGKLAESGQKIASDVKNAVTGIIGQISNGLSGLMG